MLPRLPLAKSLADLAARLFCELSPRYLDPDRWFVSVTPERLRRPTPTAIEQRDCGSNARAFTLATLRDFDVSFESRVGVRAQAGEFRDNPPAARLGCRSVPFAMALFGACSEWTVLISP
jgi:hypothetical protein